MDAQMDGRTNAQMDRPTDTLLKRCENASKKQISKFSYIYVQKKMTMTPRKVTRVDRKKDFNQMNG